MASLEIIREIAETQDHRQMETEAECHVRRVRMDAMQVRALLKRGRQVQNARQ